ncbi:DUF402 domain-containing protein [Streptomyces sp. SCSIO 30461]|uniref:DUF402 domain-containing protein n=1 Tax=Streptomyces sp. SCSIO 30461 TaxID=3118085 RepID=UPI0030CD5046
MSASSGDRAAAAAVEVVLVKAGRTKIRYSARLVSDDGSRVTVRALWAGESARDFGFVRFEPGDVFTEHYWRDRWYAVKEVRAGGGELKGWYCDITRPVVLAEQAAATEVISEDLDLDLWVSADSRLVIRLDEDEFAASGLDRTDPPAAREAVRALDALERLALEGRFMSLFE